MSALLAPLTINTMPEKTLRAVADHGRVDHLLAKDGGDVEPTLKQFADAGIDHHALATRLQREDADSFDRSWRSLLESIAAKQKQCSNARPDDHTEV